MPENFVHFTNSLNQTYCTLRYLEHDRMLTVIWKGTATEESIREVRASLEEMIRTHRCLVILNDVQQFYTGPAEVLRELGDTEWDSLVAGLGVRALVHVLKPDTEPPLPLHDEPQELEHVKYFHSKFDAIEWVKGFLKGQGKE